MRQSFEKFTLSVQKDSKILKS